jgi:hypothetical protein
MSRPNIPTRTRRNDGKPSADVFEVNETLIDIEALRGSHAVSKTSCEPERLRYP